MLVAWFLLLLAAPVAAQPVFIDFLMRELAVDLNLGP
jgi:hypothetical protein